VRLGSSVAYDDTEISSIFTDSANINIMWEELMNLSPSDLELRE
jgi:hypothetical protein